MAVTNGKKRKCLFCLLDEVPLARNRYAYVVRDSHPVTELHTLIVPYRHVETYFELTRHELVAVQLLLISQREAILAEDPTVTGFNIGVNNGRDAGQTIFHCHLHLIPRRKGDIENPRGGVRHVIPGAGYY
jgi:diadenosine tetraphosphate (Ap4A) HIT family hydrolase